MCRNLNTLPKLEEAVPPVCSRVGGGGVNWRWLMWLWCLQSWFRGQRGRVWTRHSTCGSAWASPPTSASLGLHQSCLTARRRWGRNIGSVYRKTGQCLKFATTYRCVYITYILYYENRRKNNKKKKELLLVYTLWNGKFDTLFTVIFFKCELKKQLIL